MDTIKLDALPKYDGAVLPCRRMHNVKGWPYVKSCEQPAAGLLPRELAERVGFSAICKEDARALAMDIPEDSPYGKYLTPISEG